MFLLNMAFISRSEVENIHIFHFTSEIKTIFNEKSFKFSFYYIQPFQQKFLLVLLQRQQTVLDKKNPTQTKFKLLPVIYFQNICIVTCNF